MRQLEQAIHKAVTAVRDRSSVIKPTRWQSMDVSKLREATTHEVLNYTLQAQIPSEDLDDLRAAVKPNLPWADDHFLERVGGLPLNPGVEWAHWPWGNSANSFRRVDAGPRIPAQDWAYLAGLIDGEGTIYLRPKERGFSGRVIVYQKDRTILDWLQQQFRVGLVKEQNGEDKELNGNTYQNDMHLWQVNRQEELAWLLAAVIPYLRIKRNKATEMLAALTVWTEEKKATGTQKMQLWGQEWEERFDHSYMERYWPKQLDGGSPMHGIRYPYGDARDVVAHLAAAPDSRQAFLPIWFPEDTGKLDVRVPCTLGYHFIQRHGYLHCTYYIRSCDLYRHFRDDIYLTVRLQLWMLEQLRNYGPTNTDEGIGNPVANFWTDVKPGMFTMHVVSLHCFVNDYNLLFGKK